MKTKYFLLLILFIFSCSEILAADRYWVGGPGTWDATNTANWSESSGGSGGFSVPVAADDVYFDSNSGLSDGDIVDMSNANKSCKSMSWDCPGAILARGTRTLSIAGALDLQSPVTFTNTSTAATITLNGSDNYALNMGNLTLGGTATTTITFSGSGIYTITGPITTNAALTLTTTNTTGSGNYILPGIIELNTTGAGAVNFNGNYSIPATLQKITNTGTGTGTVAFAVAGNYALASDLEVSCNGAVTFNLNIGGNNNYTLEDLALTNAGTVTFTFTGSSGYNITLGDISNTGGALAFNFNNTGTNDYTATIAGDIKSSSSIAFAGGTSTYAGKVNINGTTEGTSATFKGYNAYDVANTFQNKSGTLTFSENCPVTVDGDLINAGTITISTSKNCTISGNLATISPGNNSMILSGAGNYEIGGDVTSAYSITFSGASGGDRTVGGNITYTRDFSLSGSGEYIIEGDINSNSTRACNFSGTGQYTVKGSLAVAGACNFSGAGEYTINGPATLKNMFNMSGGGIYKFNDLLKVTSYIIFSNGNLDVSGQSVSATYFNGSSASATSTLNIANATITLTGTTTTSGYWNYSGGIPLTAENTENSVITVNINFTGKDGDNYNVVNVGTGTLSAISPGTLIFSKILINKPTATLNSSSDCSIVVDDLEFATAGAFTIAGGSEITVNNSLSKTNSEVTTIKAESTATIKMGSNSTVNMDVVGLQNIKITGPGVLYPTRDGYDIGGNEGWEFINPQNSDNTYFWTGKANDSALDNINNWETGYPGSGNIPSTIFQSGNDICFPLNASMAATTTLTPKNTTSSISFRNLKYQATQKVVWSYLSVKNIINGNISVENGIFEIKGNTGIEFSVAGNLEIAPAGTFSLAASYNNAASFGHTIVNGVLNAGYRVAVTFKDITVNDGGAVKINSSSASYATDFTIGDAASGGNLTINGTGTFSISAAGTSNIYLNGGLIDPNDGLSAGCTGSGSVNFYLQAASEEDVDSYESGFRWPEMPNITQSTLVFNMPNPYTLPCELNIPDNNINFGANCANFSSGNHDIVCKNFRMSNVPTLNNQIINMGTSTITLQQFLNTAAANTRKWDIDFSDVDLIFNNPTAHRLEYAQIFNFNSIRFTDSAPAADIFFRSSAEVGAMIATESLINDVSQIRLNSTTTSNLYLKADLLTLNKACDIYSVENGSTNTYTLSVKDIEEADPDECDSKSKIYSSAYTQIVFNSEQAITTNDIQFEGVRFTGTSLTTGKSNDLGNNTGSGTTVIWTTDNPASKTYYWIGGEGNWNDPSHWSLVSGDENESDGCLPGSSDDVVFDSNSFTSAGEMVTIPSDASTPAVRNIIWEEELIDDNKQGVLSGLTLIVTSSADFRGCSSIASNITLTGRTNNEYFKSGEKTTFTKPINFVQEGVYTITGPLLANTSIIHRSGGIICQDSISCSQFDSRTIASGVSQLWRWLDFSDVKLTVSDAAIDKANAFYLHLDSLDLGKTSFAGSNIYTKNGGIFVIAGTAGAEAGNPQTLDLNNLYATGSITITRNPNLTIAFNTVEVRPNNLVTKTIYPFTCNNLFLKAAGNYSIPNSPTYKLIIKEKLSSDASICNPINLITSSHATYIATIDLSGKDYTIATAAIRRINVLNGTLTVSPVTDDGVNGVGNNANVIYGDVTTSSDFYWIPSKEAGNTGSGFWNDPAHWAVNKYDIGFDPEDPNPSNCVPSRYDNVFFDNESFTAVDQVVKMDSVSYNNCRNMTWTDAAGAKAPVLAGYTSASTSSLTSNTLQIYGSIELTDGMKIQSGVNGGLLFSMLGTITGEYAEAQTVKFNGFGTGLTDASPNTNRYFRFGFAGGGRYDLLDDTPCRIYSASLATFAVSSGSSFYSNGHTILARNITVSNGANADLSGSLIDLNYSLSMTAGAANTVLADNTEIYVSGNVSITNNTGNDLNFNNLYNRATGTFTTNATSNPIVFNKIMWTAGNSTVGGTATLVTDTLQYYRSSLNTISGGKTIVVNKKLIASGNPCGIITIQSSNTTPAIIKSGECEDITINFAQLKYITADISECGAVYTVTGDPNVQVETEGWIIQELDLGNIDLLGGNVNIVCDQLPYIPKTDGFGDGDLYTWSYKAPESSSYIELQSDTKENGGDIIEIFKAGSYLLKVEYGASTCNVSDEINVTIESIQRKAGDVVIRGDVDTEACTYLGTEDDNIEVICEEQNVSISYDLEGATSETGLLTLEGVTFNKGITIVTATVTDTFGNEDSYTYSIRVHTPNWPIVGPESTCTDQDVYYYVAETPIPLEWKVDGVVIENPLANNQIVVNWSTPGTKTIELAYKEATDCTATVFEVYVSAATSTWQGISEDWNLAVNWDNGVPGSCTYVIIPGDLNNYPILAEETNAVCDIIEFKFGGEVAKANYLDYNAAKVELTLNGGRWYMLAPPLQNMYSGDYTLSPNRINPRVWMQQYQTINPQYNTDAVAASWSGAFTTLDVSLNGGMGSVIWVESEEDNDEKTFLFPKINTEYQYFDGGVPKNKWTGTLDRTNASRLIDYGTGATGFSLPIAGDAAGFSTAIVGNPFMSHLDFVALSQQETNRAKINPKYYIWNNEADGAFEVVMGDVVTSSSALDEKYIAPMQSFIVEKVSPETTIGNLLITPAMSVSYPGNTLRSSQLENNYLKLNILRGDRRNSGIIIAYDPEASNGYNALEDAWTLFSTTVGWTAVGYSLIDGKAASINTVGNLSDLIPLGIRTSELGKLKFQVSEESGLIKDYDIFLEDCETGTVQNLGDNGEYVFENTTGNVEDRFFLTFSKKEGGGTGISTKDALSFDIRVVGINNSIRITSSIDDPIQSLRIYSVHGELLYKNETIGNSNYAMEFPSNNKVLIVSVTTKFARKNTKIILK